MKKTLLLFSILIIFMGCSPKAVSPDGNISMQIGEDGSITVLYKGQTAVELASVGMTTATRGEGLVFQKIKKTGNIVESYEMVGGKKLLCSNEANEYVYQFKDSLQKEIKLVFRLYNDGVAFRYEIPALEEALIKDELTTIRIPEGRKRWMQTYDQGYEGFYPESTTGKITTGRNRSQQ